MFPVNLLSEKPAPAMVWALLLLLSGGCGDSTAPTATRAPQRSTTSRSQVAVRSATGKSSGRVSTARRSTAKSTAAESKEAAAHEANGPGPEQDTGRPERRTLADLFDQPADSANRWIENLPRMQINEGLVRAAGIRKLSSKRLTLYTDMPSSPEIDILPEMFDQAFPQWCEYFGIDPTKYVDWKMTGFLMLQKTRFQQTGLLPGDLPPFEHGYCRNFELWLYDQPSDYYRRHLLLHEGTHGLMNTILHGCGRPWYMEGVAELLATHRWRDGRLTLNYMPADREEVPEWGRIRIIKDAIAAGRAMRLSGVIGYSGSAHLETEPYAWCWAAAALLERHPRYHERFRTLSKEVLAADFNKRFHQMIGDDWGPLCEEWQVMVTTLEYGHDIAKTVVDFSPGKAIPSGGATVTVAADAGWQNSGLRVEAGVAYRLTASGRYQVAQQPKIWWCEPNGVSIRYYMGRPLGVLLAAVRPDQPQPDASSGLLRIAVVGLQTTLKPPQAGTLYLKINDSPAELGDNAGELQVEITPSPTP